MTTIIHFITTLFLVTIISSIGACASTQSDGDDHTVSTGKTMNVTLASKDSGEIVREFKGTDEVSSLMSAFDNRERRYEKLMPLFEYKMNVNNNGEQETWFVNKAGYIRRADSSELYKMDVSTVFN